MAKFIVEKTVEIYSPKDWKLRVETTTKFELKTAKHETKKVIIIVFFALIMIKRLKTEEAKKIKKI